MNAASEYYDLATPVVKIRLNSHAKEAFAECNFEPVGWNSPYTYRKAAERLAYYFRREFDYDFVQYTANEHKFNGWKRRRDRVLMFGQNVPNILEPDARQLFFGAVCIRWIQWDNAPAGWALDWAWFHPYERGRGHMSRA